MSSVRSVRDTGDDSWSSEFRVRQACTVSPSTMMGDSMEREALGPNWGGGGGGGGGGNKYMDISYNYTSFMIEGKSIGNT